MRKFLLTLIVTCAVIISASAQTEKPLKGIWKLTRTSKDATEDIKPVAYKLFDSDNSFSNLKLSDEGLALSHKGVFTFNAKENVYSESVVVSNITASETTNKLKLTLSDDKKSFILQGTIALQVGKYDLYEVWTKID